MSDVSFVREEGPDSVRGPDVAYYSFARIAKDAMPDDYSGPAPELVFEVLSKTDRWSSTLKKTGEYLGVDVLVVCIVIPQDRTVRLFRGDGTDITLTESDVLKLPEIQPTFEVKVSELFT